jgi:putative transposase
MYLYKTQTLKLIKSNDTLFKIIDDLAFKSKNIYNSAIYLCRQYYFSTGKILTGLDKKHREAYNKDYTALPAKTSQEIIRSVNSIMESFKKSSKDFQENPSKYRSRPRLPKYKDKENGRYLVIFNNQQLNFEDNKIKLKHKKDVAPILPDFKTNLDFNNPDLEIQQLRLVPLLNSYRVDLIYTIWIPDKEESTDTSKSQESDTDKNTTEQKKPINCASIDLGVNNFAAIVTYRQRQQDSHSLILTGKGLKSYNKYFNKKLSAMKSYLKTTRNLYTSKAIKRLYDKRNRVFKDFYHKSSRFIINYCLENDIQYILVGYNKNWKYKSKLSKKVNQTFIQFSYKTFIDMLSYKCREANIEMYTVNESYTSGTSFLDNEAPTPAFYQKQRRIKRGLFQHNNPNFKTSTINADINAAYQILSKATKGNLSYEPQIIKQSSIEPVSIRIDTFKRSTPKLVSQRDKYTLKQIKVS